MSEVDNYFRTIGKAIAEIIHDDSMNDSAKIVEICQYLRLEPGPEELVEPEPEEESQLSRQANPEHSLLSGIDKFVHNTMHMVNERCRTALIGGSKRNVVIISRLDAGCIVEYAMSESGIIGMAKRVLIPEEKLE